MTARASHISPPYPRCSNNALRLCRVPNIFANEKKVIRTNYLPFQCCDPSWIGRAGWRFHRRGKPIHERPGRAVCGHGLSVPNRAGDGRIWRQQPRSRWHEFRRQRRRVAAAAVSGGAAARLPGVTAKTSIMSLLAGFIAPRLPIKIGISSLEGLKWAGR
jgi:hypothetical protein